MTEKTDFDSLGLIEPLLKALSAQGYERPTPIQAGAIPVILSGRDLLGCARTGTGKTAAFALPSLQLLETDRKDVPPRSARMLVLTPTRELAAQVEESFRTYGANTGLRFALAFGGVGKAPQVKALSRGVDVLVATPGRLLDLRADGAVKLDSVEFFVLDEADRMLDMGFIHDMRKVFSFLPKKRQTLLFSATMPKAIQEIAASILTDPAFISVDPPAAPASGIEQGLYHVSKDRKRALLVKLLSDGSVDRALVFTRTKHLANRVAAQLNASGVSAEAIHANKSQTHRTKVLAAFKSQDIRVLVATDIAARGIDIDELPHVINYEIPNEPETYVHRIGRTARAGASGSALSFCEEEEKPYVKAIEKLIGSSIPVIPVPELPEIPALPPILRPARGQGRDKARDEKRERAPKAAKEKPQADKREKAQASARGPERAKPAEGPKQRGLFSGKKDRAPFPRDEAATRRENAARIQDQIAAATGGNDGRGYRDFPPDRRDRQPEAPRPFRQESRGHDSGKAAAKPRGFGQGGGQRRENDVRQRGPGGEDRFPRLKDPVERAPISDEEAARRAANDPRQPGIIPFNGPAPREPERQANRRPFGRRGGRR